MPVMEYRGTYNQTKAYYYTKAGTLWLHSKKGRVEKCGNHAVHFAGLVGALLIETNYKFSRVPITCEPGPQRPRRPPPPS